MCKATPETFELSRVPPRRSVAGRGELPIHGDYQRADDDVHLRRRTRTPTGTPTQTPTPGRTPTRTPTPTPTSTSVGFPTTNVLDDFDRGNGSLGSNWSGDTAGYSVASNRLDVGAGEDIYWNVSAWGANQEAFVTLTNIDSNGGEQDLLLKSQSSSDWSAGVLEVWYDAANGRVQVWTYTEAQNWVQRGGDIAVTFANGDQLGARATADGQVKVYRNGALLATRDVTGWTYYAEGGYIGLWFINAGNAVLDDFGGGTATQASVGPDGGRARGLAAPAPEKGPSFLSRLLDWLRSLFSPAPPRAVNAHPPMAVSHAGQAAPQSAPPEGQTWRTYYYAGSVRVAMRVQTNSMPDVVYYLHADHLGSTSLTTDASGATFSEQRYYPYGGTRYGSSPTDRQFTGQRNESDLGSLYDYGARFYSASLNRWIQPDTIVPQPGNPQDLNRFSYVRNNPLKHIDPSGHCGTTPTGESPCATGQTLTVDMNVSGVPDQLAAPIPAAVLQMGIPESGFYVRPTDPSAHTSQSGPSETEVKIWRTVMWGLGAIGGIGGPIAGLQASGSVGQYMAMPGGQAVLGAQSPQYVAAASFRVGPHGSMPSPRPSDNSHHGVMSVWMATHYAGYDENKAPAILMPTSAHQKTYGVYNTWRANMKQKMGGVFDWANVSVAEMRQLSEMMFNAAKVPQAIRD